MRQMETDLGTELDFDRRRSHNTGHPHTHIMVRGVTDDGKILNIEPTTSPMESAIGRASWSPASSGIRASSNSPASSPAKWTPNG
jgi:hypothetical protein